MGNRLALISIIFSLLYAGTAFNFYNLQIQKGNYYLTRAESQRVLSGELEPERGSIFFTDAGQNLVPAAIKRYQPVIYAVPKEIADCAEAAAAIAPILGQPAEEIARKINRPELSYQILEKKATDEQVRRTEALGLRGVYVGEEAVRFYPNDSLASHILGFVTDKIGKYGAESFYNDKLAGEEGRMNGEKIIPPRNGADVRLTIDRNVQSAAEQILGKLVSDYKAEKGMIAAMETKTGAILAMAVKPDFDPNNYGGYPLENFLNPFIQAIYEPGSVFKLITMSAGIDSGKITPETEYDDTGRVVLNGHAIMNWDKKARGRINMTTVLEQSLNTGSTFAEMTMGHQIFYDYLSRFGFERKTGIDAPGEVVGNVKIIKNGKDIDFATASFGQGIAITPIQLLTAVNTIANRGLMVRPHLIQEKTEELSRPITEETSREVIGMMVSAVEKGQMAKISGYTVAGKTGTAQVPDLKKGGYTADVINSYIGFVPAYDARFVILVRLDRPEGAPLAGITVTPAFRELAQFMLNYYKVAPDKIVSGG